MLCKTDCVHCNECIQWTHCVGLCVNMSEELLARLSHSRTQDVCSSALPKLYPRMDENIDCDLRKCTTIVMLMALRSTQTVTLVIGFVAVLTLAIFTCRRFDLSPSWLVAILTMNRLRNDVQWLRLSFQPSSIKFPRSQRILCTEVLWPTTTLPSGVRYRCMC